MIWGRKQSAPQAYVWFAWYPVPLEDGRWAWLHHVRAEPFNALEWEIAPIPRLAWRYHAIGWDE